MAKSFKPKDKKSKGPKGKKARAKAKLDRQWGEEMKEAPLRKGKSRILSKKPKSLQLGKKEQPSTLSQQASPGMMEQEEENYNRVDAFSSGDNDNNDNDDYDDDTSDDAGASDDDGAGAYSSLLETIRKNKANDESGDDSEDGEDMEGETFLQDVNDVNEKEMEDSDAEEENIVPDRDPFSERFARVPLVENEEKRSKQVTALQETTTVIATTVDMSLDLQVSKTLCETLGLVTTDNTKTTTNSANAASTDWDKLSRTFFTCNRELLQRKWKPANVNKSRKLFTPLQSLFYPLVSNYADVLLTCDSRKERLAIQKTVMLHALNHVLTSRGRIQKHNKRIHVLTAEQKEAVDEEKPEQQQQDSEVWRDQGFTRPTVLILLPTRGACYSVVQTLLAILGDDQVVDNMDRLQNEYGPPVVEGADALDPNQERRRKKVLAQKGPDWLELFGDNVNDDDDFKLGLSLNTKGPKRKNTNGDVEGTCAVKLYTDFYRSDIILASPLGLKMATAASSEDKPEDADFLSSIEVCVVNRADALLMQNWDHMTDVLNLMNQQPRNSNDTDFSRVRHYHLAGQAAHWRQMIVTSTIQDPVILSTFKRFAKSCAGLARVRRRVPANAASITGVILPTRQVFQRVAATSFATQSQDRLDYFCNKVLPQIFSNQQRHTLIFIPSYFDFVAVRNVLLKQEVDFVSVTEYARTSEVSRGRARFAQGLKPLMLYTGRAHFFHRHMIKGARHLVFLGLPEQASFYTDHVNLLNDSELMDNTGDTVATAASCLALFTRYESHALERIVGSSNCSRMVKGEKSTFLFAS
jgi:U3 small nucleolar RNA-associated protein 25